MLNTSTNPLRRIAAGDHVTFDTDEGHQAGIVNDLRRAWATASCMPGWNWIISGRACSAPCR